MVIKKIGSTLLVGAMATTVIFSGHAVTTYAKESAKVAISTNEKKAIKDTAKVVKQKKILAKAETANKRADKLNEDIRREIERIQDERRLAKETKVENVQHIKELAEQTYFSDYDVRLRSGLDAEQVEALVAGTGLEGLGKSYVKAENIYGVNALVLLGISAHESAWGNSRFAKERNNLFGYQAYDHDVNKAKHFKSGEEAIMTVARHLSRNYLTKGAMYFNGYTLKGINVRYASDKNWSNAITNIIMELAKQL